MWAWKRLGVSDMAYSQEIADAICTAVAEGQSLRNAAVSQGIAHSTFLLWVAERRELADQYARAREAGADLEFEGLHEHSDAEPERDEKGKIDPAWVALQKLRIDTRKWTLARKAPKKYGDKVTQELTGPDGGEIAIITRRVVDPRA